MHQNAFPPGEFQARRRKPVEAIGSGAHALIPGAPAHRGNEAFRQYNEFHYLCGAEVPHAYLFIAGQRIPLNPVARSGKISVSCVRRFCAA
ncbi:MAG: aminopeptidase P N-terminal domain-containing protein [Candidatus Sumerlaeota bacterium]|nr:aminopeptidase P N-terminal domain-containing protein [Candidatus Sumerlaeota bacterium]